MPRVACWGRIAAQHAAASDDARGKQPRFKSNRPRASRLSGKDVGPLSLRIEDAAGNHRGRRNQRVGRESSRATTSSASRICSAVPLRTKAFWPGCTAILKPSRLGDRLARVSSSALATSLV